MSVLPSLPFKVLSGMWTDGCVTFQALGGWLWPLPDAVRQLGPLHGVLLKKLALQAAGAAVAAFSLKVTCYLIVVLLCLDAAAAAFYLKEMPQRPAAAVTVNGP